MFLKDSRYQANPDSSFILKVCRQALPVKRSSLMIQIYLQIILNLVLIITTDCKNIICVKRGYNGGR